MLEGLDAVDWHAYPRPDGEPPEVVPRALRRLAAITMDDEVMPACHRVLFAIGNNHRGSLYPAALAAVPFVIEIACGGSLLARIAAIEVLTDIACSFAAEPAYERIVLADGTEASLTELVLAAVADAAPLARSIVASRGPGGELRHSAQGLLEVLEAPRDDDPRFER